MPVSRYMLLLLLVISCLSQAAALKPYREARLVKSEAVVDQFVEIPLSKIERSGRGWEPESVVRIKGDVVRSLYKLGRNVPIEDVLSYYKNALSEEGKPIFECLGRDCGSSNAWANNFFDNYLLYGSDGSQFLKVVQSVQGDYHIIYINRRGAGDIMVRLDEVKPSEDNVPQTEFAAQMDVMDLPRIRRFINELPENQKVVGFVACKQEGLISAIERGDRIIDTLLAGLSTEQKRKVRFINIADVGKEALGDQRVSFVYIYQ